MPGSHLTLVPIVLVILGFFFVVVTSIAVSFLGFKPSFWNDDFHLLFTCLVCLGIACFNGLSTTFSTEFPKHIRVRGFKPPKLRYAQISILC